MEISVCPTCGSKKMKKVRGPLTRKFEGEAYTVPDITYHECPDCGEHLYEPDAMDKLQAASPAFRKRLKKAANH
jgi:YgiT-type zinc finger domain-containing protein